eukprot:Clim_evm17s149 gene=Clim_evmTU17s149
MSDNDAVLEACGTLEPGTCSGLIVTYRIMLGFTLFHSVLCLTLIGVQSSQDPRAVVQNGLWPLKILALAGIIAGAFFIPVSAIINYYYPAIILALFFLILQAVVLVDFAHSIAESLIAKYEESGGCIWRAILIGLAALMFACIFVAIVLMYYFFAPSASCSLQIFFITINLILGLIALISAVHPKVQEHNPSSGILQAGVAWGYTAFLVFSAVASDPNGQECNEFASEGSTDDTAVIIGAIITILAVVWGAFRLGGSDITGSRRNVVGVNKGDDDDDFAEVTYSYSVFHLAFVLAACYVALLMSDWEKVTNNTTTGLELDQSKAGVWVKIASSWITMLLYLWTLYAPIIFPNRDFSWAEV